MLFDLRRLRGRRDLTGPLTRLYGDNPGFDTLPDRLRALLARHWAERPADLPARIPYLQNLGITYAHMIPCLKPRPGKSDGGYAAIDYRAINPALGTMDEFEAAGTAFRAAGISPCIDMVLNLTAKEHDWATRARTGDPACQALYRMFDDATLPRQYERRLVNIGWPITEEDAAHIPPMSGPGHRSFLADFYNGSFPGSFARGADFQPNPETGDRLADDRKVSCIFNFTETPHQIRPWGAEAAAGPDL